MMRRILAIVSITLMAAAVLGVALEPAACHARAAKARVTSLSRVHAKAGARLTIRGSFFGSKQGLSTVTFGERPQHTFADGYTFTPCAKRARVVSWSRSSITVRVPSMSPGVVGAPSTSHSVYVTVRGKRSNSKRFFIDPAIVIDANTDPAVVARIFPNSRRTVRDITYENSPGSRHASYTTHLTLDATVGVLSNSQSNALANNVHDVLVKDVTFVNTNSDPILGQGVLYLSGVNQYNITFYNCVITNNLKTVGEGSNGIKANSWGAGSHRIGDWTFADCSIGTPNSPGGAFRRFGVEMNENPYGFPSYPEGHYLKNVQFRGCDFEPTGTFNVSFGIYGRGPDRGFLIDDCRLKGNADIASGVHGWMPGGIEANMYGFEVRNTDVWSLGGNCALVNLVGDFSPWGGADHVGPTAKYPDERFAHNLFRNVRLMTSRRYTTRTPSVSSRIFNTSDFSGVVWDNCDFDTGDANNSLAVAAVPDMASNRCWDMSTSYIHGVTREGSSPQPKTKAQDYWQYSKCPNPRVTYAKCDFRWPRFGAKPRKPTSR